VFRELVLPALRQNSDARGEQPVFSRQGEAEVRAGSHNFALRSGVRLDERTGAMLQEGGRKGRVHLPVRPSRNFPSCGIYARFLDHLAPIS
jgi:hypothetical protein